VSTSADFSNFYVEGRQGIPAPGALALLGLAGLAGTRRRR
jgi:MYXO-CTERM domain-containing protein